MTPNEIAGLRKMVEGATSSPWRKRTNKHPETNGDPWGWVSHNTSENICVPGLKFTWSGSQGEANARLIVALVNNAEGLIAAAERVERLTQTLTEIAARETPAERHNFIVDGAHFFSIGYAAVILQARAALRSPV